MKKLMTGLVITILSTAAFASVPQFDLLKKEMESEFLAKKYTSFYDLSVKKTEIEKARDYLASFPSQQKLNNLKQDELDDVRMGLMNQIERLTYSRNKFDKLEVMLVINSLLDKAKNLFIGTVNSTFKEMKMENAYAEVTKDDMVRMVGTFDKENSKIFLTEEFTHIVFNVMQFNGIVLENHRTGFSVRKKNEKRVQ